MRNFVPISILLLSVCLLALFNNCGKVGESTIGTNILHSADPQKGQLIYTSISSPACVSCHGIDGTAEVGIDLKTYSPIQIETAVRAGPGSMPSYGTNTLSDSDLSDLIAYLQTL